AIGPLLYADLLMGECYDARFELAGWSEPDFDDSQWRPVSTEPLSGVRLVSDPSQPVRVTQEVAAKTVTSPAPGTYVYDLGQNMVGWVRLRVRGKAGMRVTLRHAEVLNLDGTIYTRNLRSVQATDVYILKGGGWEVFQPRFTFHGFRYVEVTDYPGAPALEALTGCVVHSDTPFTGTFECSSPLVNQLQRNIVWGQRGNFLSIPTDCPQRDERLGWTGDAQIFVRTACFNADVSAFFTKWLADVEDAQSSQGAFPDIAPLLFRSSSSVEEGAPAWGDAGIIVPWTIYRVYGDTRIIEQHYSAMVRWIDYIHAANPNLLRQQRLNNNYGDWLSPGGDHTPKELLATAYWAYDARLMAEMADVLGYQDDARKYRNLFQGIKEAFTRAYVVSDGHISGDTQTCYVLALHMDLLPDELRAAAARHLVAVIEKKNWHLSTGFVGVGYLCLVLSEAGYTDVAYRLLNNDTFPSWGYTIKHGATTIWERWDGWTEERGFQSSEMNSFNHYSLGSVGDWLYRYVAGIDLDPDVAGYEHFIIHPRPGGGLTWARGEYASIRGKILSDWRIEGNKFLLKIVVPPNTTATVYVPASGKSEVFESGRPAEQAEGVELLRVGEGEAIFTVEAGEYEFAGNV
ncbi:MAG TPA: family 78 glycoside hydrolase catalytic domain, partial [Ktedonobacteraceae bacterium]